MIEILKFGAEWCKPCKRQDTVLEEIAETHPEVTIRDIDVEEEGNRELKRRFEPRALPTTVVLRDDEPVEQFTGFVDVDELSTTLDAIEADRSAA